MSVEVCVSIDPDHLPPPGQGRAVFGAGRGGLFVPVAAPLLRHRKVTRTVRLPSGERAKVWVDDSRTVTQIEHGEVLDAIVRPRTIRVRGER